MTPDHAAALALLDRITPGPWVRYTDKGVLRELLPAMRPGTVFAFDNPADGAAAYALPELAALYRAGVEYEAAIEAMDAVDASDTASINDVRAGLERIRAARAARKAALAAVADKLTGEGK